MQGCSPKDFIGLTQTFVKVRWQGTNVQQTTDFTREQTIPLKSFEWDKNVGMKQLDESGITCRRHTFLVMKNRDESRR